MITTTTPGNFPAIASHLGELFIAAKDNSSTDMLVHRLDGNVLTVIHRFPCGEAGAGFPSMQSVGGSLFLGYVPASGDRVFIKNLTSGEGHEHPGRFETFPVVLGVNGYAITFNNGDGYLTRTYRYDGGMVAVLNTGAGTGLAGVADDLLYVVTNDDNRASEIQWNMLNPSFAGDVFGGEGLTGGIPLVYQNSQKIILAEGSIAYMPKLAQHGDTWAAVATDYQTVTLYADITAHDFGVVEPPIDPPVIPPVDQIIKVKGLKQVVIVDEAGQRIVIEGVA